MSETTPGETPVERKLREIAKGGTYLAIDYPLKDESDAIDCGREAIRLLRAFEDDEVHPQDWDMLRVTLLAEGPR